MASEAVGGSNPSGRAIPLAVFPRSREARYLRRHGSLAARIPPARQPALFRPSPMSDLEARALALFDEYVELAPPQRAAALSRLEAREPALHAALVKLLDADAATHPLENVALDAMLDTIEGDDDDPSSMRIGNRLGPWRIDRVLESGGMGTVYEASRADGQYVKQVALKCMRAGMSSPTLIEAFMRERNHLAQLDHPHIAPLLDGGIEADSTLR